MQDHWEDAKAVVDNGLVTIETRCICFNKKMVGRN
jgi:hypothetical protein